jgi:hypothetical protein
MIIQEENAVKEEGKEVGKIDSYGKLNEKGEFVMTNIESERISKRFEGLRLKRFNYVNKMKKQQN